MQHKEQTLMRDIPSASLFILPFMVSHTLPTNWCGITNTKMSASLDASTRSGTASWGGPRVKLWETGYTLKSGATSITAGVANNQRTDITVVKFIIKKNPLWRPWGRKLFKATNAAAKHNVSVHIMQIKDPKKQTFWDHPCIETDSKASGRTTVKWRETNCFLPHLLVACAQEGTSHFHGQCWWFQSACAHSPSPQTPTFLRCCQMLNSEQHWHPLSWRWQNPCIVNSYRLVFNLHKKSCYNSHCI